jgi:hypothetical protein
MRMRHIVICGLPRSTIFSQMISPTTWFSNKKVPDHKCVLVYLKILSETLLILRRFERDKINSFCPMPPHVHIEFVVPPPGCGRSVSDFWGWGVHRARLRCLDDVNDDDMCERGVPGGALNLKFYKLPRPWSLWGSSPARENSHGRTVNRTRHLMFSSQKLWPPSH